MTYHDVLREVRERGLRLTVSGADLRLQGPQQRIDPGLIGRIKAVKAELISHLAPESPDAGYPLTLLQRGFLIGRGGAVEMGNVASHIYHEIDGCWDPDRLESALRSVAARHGALRTRFTADGRQVTEPGTGLVLGRLDLRGQPEASQQARLSELREQRSHRILPADRAPLLAADVTLLADDRMRLHVGHDGLVMDGISMFLFFAGWWRAYQRETAPDETAPDDAEASFAGYVAALGAMHDKPPRQRSRAYWLDRLPDLPPHPGLPLAASPAAITTPRFDQYAARLDPEAWAAVKARAAGAGLTPTGVLLAAYAQALACWGAGRRFTLASTVASRPPIHPRIADAIGNFSETLLVEIDLDPRQTFTERALALQARLRRDLDHRHFSGIEVLRELARRDPGADARMPYTFNSAVGYLRADVDGSALELFGPEVYTSSQTPQVWLNGFAFEQHGGVVVQADAVRGLFPDGLIRDLMRGYQSLLDRLAEAGAWSATAFDLLPAEQRARRRLVNATFVPRADAWLTDAFEARARRTPDAPAVLSTASVLSYGELLERARSAAAWLRARAVGHGNLVGLIMRRGPEQIVGILAALLAGGAYLPVDAGLPAERIRYMLRDGDVRCVLTSTGGDWAADDDGPARQVLDLDVTRPVPAPPDPFRPVGRPGPDDPDHLAYVLYTSGTTGAPKGVMVSHRSVANVVADCNERFGIGPADRFLAVSAFNFDLSVYDIFGALSAGAALVLPDADRAADPGHWLDLCGRFGVTVWNSVPAIAGLMQEHADPGGDPRLTALRLVMLSGDRIPPALPPALAGLSGDLTLVSLGGPTETTIWNIFHPIEPAELGSAIPYGRPNANNRAYVLDADGQDVPDWVTGEICAAGTGLARGYWRDPVRTSERFWVDEARAERLYRTGDLGRYLPSGEIEIAGRSDFQIKINGYRIEAGEVETRLAAIPAVKQAVVVRQPGEHGGGRLVAHLAAAGDTRPGDEEILRALRVHLPDYMTPAAVVWHDNLPLTPNGKVDRGRLTRLAPAGPAEPRTGATAAASGPASDLERGVLAQWAAVLHLPPGSLAPDSDFFDLGGDSLAAARVFTGLRKQYGVSITLDRLYDVRTVRAMAAYIAGTTEGAR
ncbi:MAG TPA: amino acid adenylation domain-containing protein [Streptosporangiaceae bacterium]|nr:amino acid adenylation domain-containing protein [Streptosporangiaceae bacterium]